MNSNAKNSHATNNNNGLVLDHRFKYALSNMNNSSNSVTH
jgi:hypothetical protein